MNRQPDAAPSPTTGILDPRTFAVGVLTITAAVLLVGWLMISAPRAAYAIGMLDRGGDYIMVTQQISNSEEVVVVIDAASDRMNVYLLDANSRKLALIQSNFPLDRLPTGKRDNPPRGGRP